MEIIKLDLFSGIGGFPLGLEKAGFKIVKHYYSEVDKHCIANYNYNFKNSIYVGPVETVSGRIIPEKIDFITFGSPCQDFSTAGKTKGLNGKKSSLIQEAIRIITEKRPSFFIWENVKGAFSANDGADFWAIIQAFANIGGYSIEWQLLDTLWFLPQSRPRVYLIGHLTEPGRNFKPVFPIIEKDIKNKPCNKSEKLEIKQLNPVVEFNNSPRMRNRIYDPSGSMCTLNRAGDNAAIRVISGQPRTGDKSKGGSGILYNDKGMSYCLSRNNGDTILNYENQYRYLTEIERERLQGFPDNWTKYGDYNGQIKEISRTNRESMTGNAITVDVVQLIAEKIKQNYYQ